MVKDYQELVSLPIGTKVIWPEVTGEEVLTLRKITKTEIKFSGEIGIDVPLGRLINYPTIILFSQKKKVHAPMFIHQGGINGETRQEANGA